ncbi:MAG: thiamine pyrophosphate-dependent enzyme, partial [Lachnospiraceae bacterium]|nr:thiamine pyrophosphate-dependent enzyme [Lachnospiraceae bacterium]
AQGHGPAWSNSLFEDAAEFGYGMLLAQRAVRDKLADKLDQLVASTGDAALTSAVKDWKDTFNDGVANQLATEKVVAALGELSNEEAKEVLVEKDFLSKKSQWIFGGDGWGYDIGFGGLDHVIASGKDVNILVVDTEVYSNTGGQSSKATPIGAVAEFAAGGKQTKKKDLASICMSYGYVYVAQIAMGADMNQAVKAIAEAEAYPGPSVIIAYAPCINHGIKKGMSKAMTEEELAVKAGYWFNFRFDPSKESNKFTLDSKTPTDDYKEFLAGENRYASLTKFHPDTAEVLFAKGEEGSKERYAYLNKLVSLYAD